MDATKERVMRGGRWLLSRLIPFEEWLGLAPRTDGDLDTYHRILRTLRAEAATGITPPWEPGPPMSVSVACLDDEESFFRFDPPATPATHD